MGNLGARGGSVRVRMERNEGCGRTIFLVRRVFLFLCRQCKNMRVGRRGIWEMRIRNGFKGCGWGVRCRGTDLIWWGWGAEGERRRALLTTRERGRETVRACNARDRD
jgi:hypothetical protein